MPVEPPENLDIQIVENANFTIAVARRKEKFDAIYLYARHDQGVWDRLAAVVDFGGVFATSVVSQTLVPEDMLSSRGPVRVQDSTALDLAFDDYVKSID